VENERQLHEVARAMGLEVVVVRPGVVLGRGASPFHWGIAAWPANSVARLWGDGSFHLPTVLVDDCADAIARALWTPDIDGRSYNLVGPPLITGRQYIDALSRHTGVHIRCDEGPAWRHFVTARLKWQLKSLAGSVAGPAPHFVDSRSRSLAATFDASRARADLGWRPTADLLRLIAEGIHAPADEWMSSVVPRDPAAGSIH
jgi:nucleoside-diphosphate-sugar epimerase